MLCLRRTRRVMISWPLRRLRALPPNLDRSLGICHLEAMASGKPSVIPGMAGCGSRYRRRHRSLVAPGYRRDVAAILRFLMNPDLAERFGQAARARAEKLFDIAANNAFTRPVTGISESPSKGGI